MPEVQSFEVEGREVRVSHLDKVLFPRTGTTKAEVLQHYLSVAPLLLPLLADRCVTRLRWPHGVEEPSFFEKNVPAGTPDWVRVVEVPSKDGSVRFPVIDSLATLVWLVNLSSIELHVHQWKVAPDGSPLPPDRLVVDLDPGPPAGLEACAQVAVAARTWLAHHGLTAFPVLSGSKGMHLYSPLTGSGVADAETAAGIARDLATTLEQALPDLVTATMTKALRPGKVFVDWSQNAAAKTTLTPYSLRGRPEPRVAAPVTWSEVEGIAAGAGTPSQLSLSAFEARREPTGHLLDGLWAGRLGRT